MLVITMKIITRVHLCPFKAEVRNEIDEKSKVNNLMKFDLNIQFNAVKSKNRKRY